MDNFWNGAMLMKIQRYEAFQSQSNSSRVGGLRRRGNEFSKIRAITNSQSPHPSN